MIITRHYNEEGQTDTAIIICRQFGEMYAEYHIDSIHAMDPFYMQKRFLFEPFTITCLFHVRLKRPYTA